MRRRAAHNSTYKKLAVQWLNEALCFVSSLVVAESFVLLSSSAYVSFANPKYVSGNSLIYNLL